jgi:hypothetical protein
MKLCQRKEMPLWIKFGLFGVHPVSAFETQALQLRMSTVLKADV